MKQSTLTPLILLAVCRLGATAYAESKLSSREQSFDTGWQFLRADAPGAEGANFNDSTWRKLDVPHDWSIEDLTDADASAPDQPATNRIGPFDRNQSKGGGSTGHVVGGTAWYRKHFTLPSNEPASSSPCASTAFT